MTRVAGEAAQGVQDPEDVQVTSTELGTRPSPRPSHARALTKSSLASVLATAVEFALIPVLVRGLHMPKWLVFAVVQFVANAITFALYKYWAFDARHLGSVHTQYLRQLLVFGGSLALNTAIPSYLSYQLHLAPELAFGISQVLVYLAWNYPGNRYFVFRS